MNFTEEVKNEIVNSDSEPCCNIAGLSAFVKCTGTVETVEGKIGFSISGESVVTLNNYLALLKKRYGEEPYNISKVKRSKAEFLSDKTVDILLDLGIIVLEDGGYKIQFGIDKYLVENYCCKIAYLKGAFLGCGSVSLPNEDNKIGYHLEFDFSNYFLAGDFCEILLDLDIMAKLIERRSRYVIYFNSYLEVCKILKLLGAKNCVKKLNLAYETRQKNNNGNRRYNCDMSNISKQVNAFLKQKEAINLIEQTIGFSSLTEELQLVCKARLSSPELTLEDLARQLGISKSCLNHRLRKIVEISKGL